MLSFEKSVICEDCSVLFSAFRINQNIKLDHLEKFNFYIKLFVEIVPFLLVLNKHLELQEKCVSCHLDIVQVLHFDSSKAVERNNITSITLSEVTFS